MSLYPWSSANWVEYNYRLGGKSGKDAKASLRSFFEAS